MRIVWSPDYELGILLIDQQHRRIVDYINDLDRLAGQPDAQLGVARVLSGGMNFTLNRHLVFRGGRRTPLGAALVRYVVLAGVVLAGGVLLVDTLAAIGLPLVVAKVGADLLLFAVSYLVQRLVVFRGR